MNGVIFDRSMLSIERLLKDVKFYGEVSLLKQKGTKKIYKDGLSNAFKSIFQTGEYFRIYTVGKENYDFDFLLQDESYLQFSISQDSEDSPPELRYAFFQNPQYFITYEEFLGVQDIAIEDVGETFQEFYDQFLIEAELNSSSIPIRYDLDKVNYKPIIHSTSHFHIGHNNDVRIPCKMILTPMMFTLFIIKHSYYNIWKQNIENPDGNLNQALNLEKRNCSNLSIPFWDDLLESKELFFI